MRSVALRLGAELPPRPYIPPLAAGALGAIIASAAMMESGWHRYLDEGPQAATFAPIPLAIALALMSGSVLLCVRLLSARSSMDARAVPGGRVRALRTLSWLAFGILLAGASASIELDARSRSLSDASSSSLYGYSFRVVGDPSDTRFGFRSTASMRSDRGIEVAFVEVSSDVRLEAGESVRLVGRFERFEASDWARGSFMGGAVGTVSAVSITERASPEYPITRARDAVLQRIDPGRDEVRALLAGIVCGRTTELSGTDAETAFSETGTTHLIAVSGSHLALVSALVGIALGRVPVSGMARAVTLSCAMGAYVLFTGGAPSAVRSLVMVTCTLASRLGGRRPHGLTGLSIAVMALVTLEPGVVFDLGFQLSALSVASILVFGRYLEFAALSFGAPRALAAALSCTLAALWATIPVTLPIFGELSLISPVANLVLGPVMSALLVAGILAVPMATIFPSLEFLLSPLDALARISIFLADAFAAVPFASIAVDASDGAPLIYLLAALSAVIVYRIWKMPARRSVVALTGAVALIVVSNHIYWHRFAPPELIVLDVGQGDSILIRDGAERLLVDCGVDGSCARALARNHVGALDAIVITHWDADHWGGLPEVLDQVPVERIVVPRGAADKVPREARSLDLPDIIEVDCGDMLQTGSFACEVVWPREAVVESGNSESLVLDVAYAGGASGLSVLLTGDTEADQAERYLDAVGDTDVLKLGHHGSAASLDEKMMSALDPAVCIASAGEGNRYGHPAPSIIEIVEDFGARFLCTIDAGDVSIAPAQGGLKIATQHHLEVE